MGEFIQYRLNICGQCPFNADQICILCGCNIDNKVKVKEESCPKIPKAWDAYVEPKPYKQPPQLNFGDGGHNRENPPSENTGGGGCLPCQNRH